jgi:hypothetical protein
VVHLGLQTLASPSQKSRKHTALLGEERFSLKLWTPSPAYSTQAPTRPCIQIAHILHSQSFFMLQICCHKATNCLEQAESSALLPIHPPKDPRISTTAQGHRKEIHHRELLNPNASPRLFLGPWCCESDIGTVEFFSSNSIALLLLVSLCYLLFLGWFEANELGLFGEKKQSSIVDLEEEWIDSLLFSTTQGEAIADRFPGQWRQQQNCKQLCSGQFAHYIKDQMHENFSLTWQIHRMLRGQHCMCCYICWRKILVVGFFNLLFFLGILSIWSFC